MVTHPVIMRGLGATARGAGALLLRRSDDDFMAAAMREASDPALTTLMSTRVADHDEAGTLRLFQPVHRMFHLALFEVYCDTPGVPRLDPEKIDSAGFVVRRVASARGSGPFGEAWMMRGDAAVGWRKLAQAQDTRFDPDPERRALPDQGSAELNDRIAAIVRPEEQLAEDVVRLFVAGPEVCEKAGRTILIGLVPTVSSDAGEAAAASPYDDDEIDAQIPAFLRAGKPASIRDIAGRRFTYEGAEDLAREAQRAHGAAPSASDSDSLRTSKEIYGFIQLVRVLAVQLDAFGDASDARKLRDALHAIELRFGERKEGADTFLASAAEALVMSPGTGTPIVMPDAWPEVSSRAALAIRTAFAKVLQARFSGFAPRATRFDDPAARYRIHGFVRVTSDDGCAPELVWSDASPPYLVAPWYESAGAPPVLVRLPPINRKNIRKLKPNVSFTVPKGLFNMLNCNKPAELIAGNGVDCGEGGLDWICGFNIPIITLCAFIVLYIFLSLLNIIFFWLPFVRICFPLPRKMPELSP
jgi:hypothetical protein